METLDTSRTIEIERSVWKMASLAILGVIMTMVPLAFALHWVQPETIDPDTEFCVLRECCLFRSVHGLYRVAAVCCFRADYNDESARHSRYTCRSRDDTLGCDHEYRNLDLWQPADISLEGSS